MQDVYLDSAATSYHRPPEVLAAINNYFNEIKASPGRGGYRASLDASRIIHQTRAVVKELFTAPKSEQVIFTPSITYSLNYALKGLLEQGDHVLTTTMEHNAVVRPLKRLEDQAMITVDYIKCATDGSLNPADLEAKINNKTKLIVLTHASNVTGTLLPVGEIAEIAKKHDLIFILDTAQTAGVYPLDLSQTKIDILTFTGHKNLFGPPGTGGFVINQETAKKLKPLIEGGTGSTSDKVYQPEFLPDKFESGTPNTPGIAGLKAGIEYIQQEGISNIKAKQSRLKKQLFNGLKSLEQVEILGPDQPELATATISIAIEGFDLGELSYLLASEYNIMTRSGLHCAPLAHRTINTFPAGTLRLSLSYFTTQKEIEYTLNSLAEIIKQNG